MFSFPRVLDFRICECLDFVDFIVFVVLVFRFLDFGIPRFLHFVYLDV